MPASGSSKMLTLCGFARTVAISDASSLLPRRTVHLAVQIIGRAESDSGEEFTTLGFRQFFSGCQRQHFFTVIPLKRGGCWNA